ncbi:MAG: helix-turn-helix domain-containing protein [Thermoplasmata archaeon]
MRFRATANVRALIHLLNHTREGRKAKFPHEITQVGIAEVLRTRRSHVSITLSSLKKKGYVENRLGRVENERRRRKVYFLTFKGYLRAKELSERYLRKKIEFVQNGILMKARIKDLDSLLGEDHSLAEVLSCIDEDGVLDLKSLTKRSEARVEGEPSKEHERVNIKSDSRGSIALYLLLKA